LFAVQQQKRRAYAAGSEPGVFRSSADGLKHPRRNPPMHQFRVGHGIEMG
jgi:hypothetical protein